MIEKIKDEIFRYERKYGERPDLIFISMEAYQHLLMNLPFCGDLESFFGCKMKVVCTKDFDVRLHEVSDFLGLGLDLHLEKDFDPRDIKDMHICKYAFDSSRSVVAETVTILKDVIIKMLRDGI